MKRNKSGVSLIVLVITIIVMIILASAVIISLTNINIFGTSKEAVAQSDLKQAQSLAAMVWSDAYLDYRDGKIDKTDIETRVKAQLIKNEIDVNKYIIKVTDKSVVVTERFPESWKENVAYVTEEGVPVPVGFALSPFSGENELEKGVVIYALTEGEARRGDTELPDSESHQTALESRNQFVWVPVSKEQFSSLFRRSNFGNESIVISPKLAENYWELVLADGNLPADATKSNVNCVSPKTLEEATAMYASVKKYGGFYIGRYEVGANNYDSSTYFGRGSLSVTMAKYPYCGIAWGTSYKNEELAGGAVTVARSFYPAEEDVYGAVSTLTYGVQWDRAVTWFTEVDKDFNINDSTNYGVYMNTVVQSKDVNTNAKRSYFGVSTGLTGWETVEAKTDRRTNLYTTGAFKTSAVCNIYDMAGSLWEWTMEGNGTANRVVRGGYFCNEGDYRPINNRNSQGANSTNANNGLRPSLYIK